MLEFTLTTIVSILFLVDPLGAVPTYLVMTRGDDATKRKRTAWRAALVATLTLGIFAATGNAVLRLFGLTMPAFGIAGGAILFLVAIDMVRAQRPTQEGPTEVREGTEKDDVAITPLGIPMLAGPASLSTVITLMSKAQSWSAVFVIYLAILFTGVVTLVTLRLSESLYRYLGRTGIQAFSRVLGLVLAAIAVQFILDGLQAASPWRP